MKDIDLNTLPIRIHEPSSKIIGLFFMLLGSFGAIFPWIVASNMPPHPINYIVASIMTAASLFFDVAGFYLMFKERTIIIDRNTVQIDTKSFGKNDSSIVPLNTYAGIEARERRRRRKNRRDETYYEVTLRHSQNRDYDVDLASDIEKPNQADSLKKKAQALLNLSDALEIEGNCFIGLQNNHKTENAIKNRCDQAIEKRNRNHSAIKYKQVENPLVITDRRILSLPVFLFFSTISLLFASVLYFPTPFVLKIGFGTIWLFGIFGLSAMIFSPKTLLVYPQGLELRSGKKITKRIARKDIQQVLLAVDSNNPNHGLQIQIYHSQGKETFGYTLSTNKKRALVQHIQNAYGLPSNSETYIQDQKYKIAG